MSNTNDTGCERCGECCGIVPCTASEAVAIALHVTRHALVPIRQGTKCPWYQNRACAIYPVRPTICRLFGRVPEMVCPHGHNRHMPIPEQRRLKRFMVRGCEQGTYLLHQAVMTLTEIDEMTVEVARQPCHKGVFR